MKLELTQELLKELLHYDPDTGMFTWKTRDARWFKSDHSSHVWNANWAGKTAGGTYSMSGGKSYVLIGVFGRRYRAHRLAHLYMLGAFPAYEVDHENGDGTDNRWKNIEQVVTHQENCKNARRFSVNTSGATGVSWFARSCKWRSVVVVNRKQVHLGYFENFDDAVAARKQAEIEYGFHKNHGQERPL